jgi:Glycosyl hydrolases family 16
VSGIQSGVFAGDVGSTVGQQPFRAGLVVRERQATQWGWTPHHGVLEVRARMELSPRSMASVWMAGLEDEPQRSGEICIFEVFGDGIDTAGAAVGMGVHPFRDDALRDDFATPRLPLDVTDFHVYAADWRSGRVDFFVDGEHVRTVEQAPDYPMQMMIGLFDFPAKPAAAAHAGHVPRLAVDRVGVRAAGRA